MEIKEIKERLSVLAVLQHYNLKSDKHHRLCCPFQATKRTSERWLGLHAGQMIQLQTYLSKNKFKEGSLLLTGTSEKNISNRMQHMTRQPQKLTPKVTGAGQFRSSVITGWLKQDNLRQVQYMAGHKYVSSTQRYQVSNLDDLQNEVQQHHPMK